MLAALTGWPIGRIPFFVRYIAARRLAADRERAAGAWAIGEVPQAVSRY